MTNTAPKKLTATVDFQVYDDALFLSMAVGEAKDGDKVYRLSMSITGGALIVSIPDTRRQVVFRPEELLRVARALEAGELKVNE